MPGALAVEDIAKALHEDMAVAQHVAEPADVLRVGDRLVERLAEIMRAQDGEVGVVGFAFLEGVPVYHRKAAVVIFLRHKTTGVLAKRAHLIAEGVGVANELSLVEDLVHVLDDFVSHLDAHAHIDRSRRMEDSMLGAQVLKPIGAASVVGVEDGEGVVASRVRQIVGKDVPIAASMDLHGCISDLLFESCDLLTCYRTAPHIDVPWTHERAARALVKVLDNPGRTLYRARVNVPVLLPGEKTSTEVEPGASMYAKLGVYQLQDDVFDTSIWMGFPWADMERCHGAVVSYGYDEQAVCDAAMAAAQDFWDNAGVFEFVGPTDTAEGSVAQALSAEVSPFFVSDTGDNPGAGGTDDSTVFLREILDAYRAQGSTKRVVFASLNDPAAVEACEQAGAGAPVRLAVGAMTGGVSGEPVMMDGVVDRLFDEYRSGGKSAVIAEGNFKVIVTTARTQFGCSEQYEAAGTPFDAEDIVVVKMGYLEPDLSAAAKGWVMALTPGAVDQDLPRLGHHKIVRPLYPFDELPFDPKLTVDLLSRA